MNAITLPDGTVVEITMGDGLSGPGDCFGKLHCNTNRVFFRIAGGPWEHCEARTMFHALLYLDSCDNAEEARAFLTWQ